ncbi:uncharacterized protein F5891DRAFT_1183663 [Suillus fuscotomentosus]|uniref:Uncharacterized protein n=1 Tax=Suillus fuscotomentosus TaxID=1912939 RepID=A0AAD4EF43_9AGAM|nr:uncharacterized protein F5891DRAFT_1183663 [Suillus fuscotomentosus]KAG1905001.1 hypothetical protein F5891DRAFT_1183663 [Suillus fuscotomentosus]
MSELHVRCATPTMSNPGDEVSSYADDKLSSIDSTESQYRCSTPTDSLVQDRRALEEDPIDWWGTYVPLESWIPPKSESIPTFQGIIGLESYPVYKCKFYITPIRPGILKTSPLNDSMGKKEKKYELCFNGDFDEVTSMLSDMYVTELLRTPNFLRGQHSRTIKGPVELGGATSEDSAKSQTSPNAISPVMDSTILQDPYDCGWDDPTVDGAAAVHEFSAPDSYNCGWEDGTTAPEEAAKPGDGNAISEECMPNSQTSPHPMDPVPDSMTLIDDPYDCGWDGAIAPSNQLSMPDPYDCGWEDQTAAPNEVIMPGERSDNDEPEEGEYYLGSQHLITQPQSRLGCIEPIPADDVYQSEWDDPMVNRAVSLNESAAADPYDCGWEDSVDTEASAMNVSSEERLNPSQDEGINQPSCQEGRDSTDDTAHLSHSIDNVSQLRHAGNRSYESGWDDPVVQETALSKSSTANPYDCGWEDDASLPEKTTTTGDSTDDTYGCGRQDFAMTTTAEIFQDPSDEHGDYSANRHIVPTDRSRSDSINSFKVDDVDMENTLPDIQKDSTEDLYDLSEMREEIDVIDLTSPEGREVIDLTSLPATSRRSSSPADPNVFEEAEESMRRAIQRLNSIGHNDFDRYIHSIVTPAVTRVPDPRPAITFMANRSLFGAYADAKDRVT